MSRTWIRNEIRNSMRRLREQAKQENEKTLDLVQLQNVVFTEERKGYVDGRFVDRFVFFLRGTGCSWVTQCGGCTFCGFWDATNFGERIADVNYMAQVQNVLADPALDLEQYPILCLYNDGSLLVEEEIGLEVVLEICDLLSLRPHVRRLVLEAKIIDITEAKVAALLGRMNGKELEIPVGFESADEVVRDLCINKPFSERVFRDKWALLQRHGVSLVPLVMIKPPFLNEAQAIADAVHTLQYLEPFQLQRIDFELATVERHTLLHELWAAGLYTPPRLWSVIEILRRARAMGLHTPVFLSPPNYTVSALAQSRNCPHCTPAVVAAIHEYNREFDISVFDAIDCSCREEWARSVEEESAVTGDALIGQIERIMRQLGTLRAPALGGCHEDRVAPDGALAH